MSLIKKLAAIFSGGSGSSDSGYSLYYYVRCRRCHEVLKARADLRNELSSEYDEGENVSGYYYRKVLVGRGRCFQPIEVTMSFDGRRNLLSKEVTGGEFISEEEYQKATAAAQ